MLREGIAMDDIQSEQVLEEQNKGKTISYVALEGELAAYLSITDPIKPSTPAALEQLRSLGIKLIVATGDNPFTTRSVAEELGIDEFRAQCSPEDKLELIKGLQKEGKIVGMAGDGINDAPALAQADIGIAMGTGSDVAIETAGITLVKGDLKGIVKAEKLSRAMLRNIRENLFFAFVYNSIGVPVAAGILFPFFGILLSPMIAAAAMSFSSVSVISNSLRLRKARI
jgi:Cu2+-exporting ATPase